MYYIYIKTKTDILAYNGVNFFQMITYIMSILSRFLIINYTFLQNQKAFLLLYKCYGFYPQLTVVGSGCKISFIYM